MWTSSPAGPPTAAAAGSTSGRWSCFARRSTTAAPRGRSGRWAPCELRVARWTEAEAHLRDALEMGDDPWLRRHRAEAAGWLAEAQSHVGRLQLSGGVPGAEVRVGDRVAGTLPMAEPLIVTPGALQIEVRAAGYRTWRRSLDVPGGAVTQEAVSLERDVPIEASTPASAAVVCAPGSVLRSGFCYAVEGGPSVPSRAAPLAGDEHRSPGPWR